MKVTKRPSNKLQEGNAVVDPTPKRIDPEQLVKIKANDTDRNEKIKSKAQARSLLMEDYEKDNFK